MPVLKEIQLPHRFSDWSFITAPYNFNLLPETRLKQWPAEAQEKKKGKRTVDTVERINKLNELYAITQAYNTAPEFVFFDSPAMRDRYGRLLSPNQNPFMRKKILPFGQHDAFETIPHPWSVTHRLMRCLLLSFLPYSPTTQWKKYTQYTLCIFVQKVHSLTFFLDEKSIKKVKKILSLYTPPAPRRQTCLQ